MSFAAPWFLLAGALAALATVALHFITRQEPRRYPFPTARFIPESREQAPSRSLRLRDLVVLALRVLAVAAAALAFARPSLTSGKRPLLRVVLADFSRSTGDTAAVQREADRLLRQGDVVVPLTNGGVSAGLVAAIRAARLLRDRADSVALLLVSPLAREEFDAATLAIRASWPGAIEWHQVRAADSAQPATLSFRARAEDPLQATLALAGIRPGESPSATIRLIRTALHGADSTWASEAGHVLVYWPEELGQALDTIGAVVSNSVVLVAPFTRPAGVPQGTPIAWWADGRVAAAESALGAGCVRTVSIPIDPEGDLALRERLRSLLRELIAPCGGPRDLQVADSITTRALRGVAAVAVPTARLPEPPNAGRALPPWLLAAALILLIAEQTVRRRSPTA